MRYSSKATLCLRGLVGYRWSLYQTGKVWSRSFVATLSTLCPTLSDNDGRRLSIEPPSADGRRHQDFVIWSMWSAQRCSALRSLQRITCCF